MKKVKLIIRRKVGSNKVLEKVVEVEDQKTLFQTRKYAELQFCNEYANRDFKRVLFMNITRAKEFCGLLISSEIVK